jgi:hypothetical protein
MVLHMQLRNNDEFYVPFARINYAERFPFFSFLRIWNSFENDVIKSMGNKLEFIKNLKEHFMSLLNPDFVCNRLLCPHCHLAN